MLILTLLLGTQSVLYLLENLIDVPKIIKFLYALERSPPIVFLRADPKTEIEPLEEVLQKTPSLDWKIVDIFKSNLK